ncbi:MAG: DUF3024 domain-containing protein, partial [Syntrophales bacterium]|nr:DUF3024 domain-containing protein [Syntrophales bacterium]
IGFLPQASTGSWGRGMTASGAPQNTDSIHRIAAAPGKTDRILPADAPVRPKPKLLVQLREGENPAAQIRFDNETKKWTLHCMDRNSRWHLYDLIKPSADFDDMLKALDDDRTGIFWG